ncbi:uncharacterized protein MKZ38_005122 [Zalerion maritima]|uniref:DUF7924 domain-containing protein n=1 Tax=Zalerion maritima TaxID=339359 RepID=A0AAD5RLN0_9PEZI|nr:uncharacterized protein MKZ38_005122 [Zalerion maritima]
MNSGLGVSKARTRRSRVTLSKDLQEELLGAVASTDTGMYVDVSGGRHANSAGTGLPQSPGEQPSVAGSLAREAPLQSMKRRLAASEIDLVPTKRARLERTDTQQPGVGDEGAKQATLQQREPKRPKQSYASFLKDFVDPVHPNYPDSVHTFVSEWLESIGSDREARCRSDSHLCSSDSNPVWRQVARSAPDMVNTRDADGYVVPPTPGSTGSGSGSGSRRPSTDNRSLLSYASRASSSSSGVRHRMYRQNNLALNDIYIRPSAAPLPDPVSSHIETVRAKRDSPGLSSDDLNQVVGQLDALAEGCDEDDVAAFLNDIIFPNPKTHPAYGPATGLSSSSNALMSQHLVPANPASPYKVTQPKPDKLYGYSGNPNAVFTQPQTLAQTTLHPRIPHYSAATLQGLRFPFFATEFKAAGGTRGDLWVATNQCAGASSACLNAIDQLNTSLREYRKVQRVDNLSYCIAVDNNTAQLYVSWKEDDLSYCLQRVDAFLLSRSEDFKSFRKQVRNILDWGKDTRLKQVRDALDIILEENRKTAAEGAKTRQPPSAGSATSSGKKPKPLPSRRNSTRSDGAQGESGEGKAHWELDETYNRWFHRNADGTVTCAEEG